MRLLASTDFALRVLLLLGAEPSVMRSTGRLAEGIGVPRNHVHKLVQQLAAMGLVRTLRGARGGVRLAREPAAINLGAVVRQLEATQPLVECFRTDGGACPLQPHCRLRGRLAAASEAFLSSLDGSTLAECLATGLPISPGQARAVRSAD